MKADVRHKQLIGLKLHTAGNTDVIVVGDLAALREMTQDVHNMAMINKTCNAKHSIIELLIANLTV